MASSFYQKLEDQSLLLYTLCLKTRAILAIAESCTGGIITSSLTSIPGSSKIFDRGFITYSNQSKIDLLNISPFILEKFGAVSHEVALAMAEGALKQSTASHALAITGIAGPEGGTEEKPIGTVHIALAYANLLTSNLYQFTGNRQEIRFQAALESIRLLSDVLH
jgi:nicotinamide-nucleotide amidase